MCPVPGSHASSAGACIERARASPKAEGTHTLEIAGRLHDAPPRPGILSSVSPGRWLRASIRRLVVVVAVLAACSLFLPTTWQEAASTWISVAILLTILAAALEFVAVPLSRGGEVSVATIAHIAILLLVPAPWAAAAIGLAVLFEELVGRRPLLKVVFNVSAFVLTASVTSFAIGLIGSPWDAARRTIEYGDQHIPWLGILIAAGATYYVVNWLLTSAIIAIASEQSLVYILRTNWTRTLLMEIGAETLGALFALIWMVEPIWTALLAAPSAVIGRALQHIRLLETQTQAAVRSLAQIVDHRDRSTFHHSERVAVYAADLARELGLDEDAVALVEQAASVHDLGKIGVPDRVLLKAGPLDDEEKAAMWLHTEIGAKILVHFELFRDGAGIVLHHHERWDGHGYPQGLAGEAIPLGSRIVAVADAFDAMTADRPYRAAMPVAVALDHLRRGAGSQWDPLVVGAFLRLLDRGAVQVHQPSPEPAPIFGKQAFGVAAIDHCVDPSAEAIGPAA